MFDATEVPDMFEIQVIKTTSMVSAGDLQNIQPSYQLNGKNYLKWFKFVQSFLEGKGKLSHLLGKCLKPGDPKFNTWDEVDSIVMEFDDA